MNTVKDFFAGTRRQIGAGTRLTHTDDGEAEDYIIAQTGRFECCAVSLGDGNRFHDPVTVKHTDVLTEDEAVKVLGKDLSYWSFT